MGFSSVKEFDESARKTIQNGRQFSYRDKASGDQRIGCWDPETQLMTATSQSRKIPIILSRFPEKWDEIKKNPGFSFVK